MKATVKTDDINITPMVDLYLVLLLIFIIMTTAGVQGIKVKLPKASKAPKIEGPKSQAITVNTENKIFLNTVPVTLAELESRLTALKTRTPEFPAVVRGDRRMQYEGIIQVLDVLGRVGVTQIALAIDPAK